MGLITLGAVLALRETWTGSVAQPESAGVGTGDPAQDGGRFKRETERERAEREREHAP